LKTEPTLSHPASQYIFVPGLRLPGKVISPGHGFQISTVLLRPKSRGEITLASNKPEDRPIIDPNFFAEEEDLNVLVKGFKQSRKFGNAPEFNIYQSREIIPGNGVQSDDDLRDFVLNNSQTIFHPVGTCKMGHDDLAVVDDRLRVRGVERLRVIDASIMPTIVSGNTNAPVIMIAEKAADMIKADAGN
jgi:choline dehydrogenase